MARHDVTTIVFRQFEIQELDIVRGRYSLLERWCFTGSLILHKLADLVHQDPIPDFNNAEGIARFAFRKIPFVAEIIPTERYYYFRLGVREGSAMGNFRLVNAEEGFMTMGYSRISNPEETGQPLFLNAERGALIMHLFSRYWLVSYAGHFVVFVMPPEVYSAPSNFRLEAEEEYVGWDRDESGVAFHLLYNKKLPSFYYVLDQSLAPIEDLQVPSTDLFLGKLTAFVYWTPEGSDRKYLIAARDADIKANTYYDGPFDQVPARRPMRDLIYAAYPYIKLGGTDPFGNFCLSNAVKMAIGPYMPYSDLEEIKTLYAHCHKLARNPLELRQCMTYDDKQMNHRSSAAFRANGDLVKGSPMSCEFSVDRIKRMFSQDPPSGVVPQKIEAQSSQAQSVAKVTPGRWCPAP